jgi:hypothetical protein
MRNEKLRLNLNVEYQVRDKDGNVKPLFQPWNWVASLIKHGLLSPLHPKIPVLLGYWSPSMKASNLVVNAGMAVVAGLINGVITDFFDYIAVGTGTTSPVAGNTTLEAEIVDSGLARAASTNSRVTTDVTNDTAQFVKSFSVTGTKAVTESGVFDAASAGNMLCRQTFSAVNVVNGDTLQVTWKIDVD